MPAVAGVGLLAVALGRHVAPADDHQAVHRVEQRPGHGGHGAGRIVDGPSPSGGSSTGQPPAATTTSR